MKILFIASSCATVYLIFRKFRSTYNGHHDTFRLEFVLIPSMVLALIFHYSFTPLEVCLLSHVHSSHQVLWSFSIFLESVAIMPQLFLVSKTGEAETITSHYLFALGSYRALYIVNWIYRYYTEGHIDYIAVVAGVVQTVLYCDFFYLYVTKGACPSPPLTCSSARWKGDCAAVSVGVCVSECVVLLELNKHLQVPSSRQLSA